MLGSEKSAQEIFELTGGMVERQFEDYWTHGISWSPQGDKVATFTHSQHNYRLNATVAVLDIYTGETAEIEIEIPGNTAFSAWYLYGVLGWTLDGQQVIFSDNGMIWFWNLQEHLIAHTLYDFFGASDIDLSPDGKQLVTSQGKLLTSLSIGGRWSNLRVSQNKVAWAPSGSKIAFSEPYGLQVFDLKEERVGWFIDHEAITTSFDADVLDFAWSPNGRYLAVQQVFTNESDGREYLKIEIWKLQLQPGEYDRFVHVRDLAFPQTTYEDTGEIIWSPDGALLAFNYEFAFSVFDVISSQPLLSLGKNSTCYSPGERSWSPDGKYIALDCNYGEIAILDTQSWEIVRFLDDTAYITSIDWSPDSRYVLVGKSDGQMNIWDVSSEQIVSTLVSHTQQIRRAIWSSTGDFIASVSHDGTIRIWGLPEE